MRSGAPSRYLRLSGSGLLAAVCLLPLSAVAQEAAAPNVLAWHCVQESDAAFHVLCVPRMGGSENISRNTVAATAHGVNLNLLPVAQRGDAEVMSADAWRIPLHVRPSDTSFVTTLLKSVLCGKHVACAVSYGAHEHEAAPMRTAAVR